MLWLCSGQCCTTQGTRTAEPAGLLATLSGIPSLRFSISHLTHGSVATPGPQCTLPAMCCNAPLHCQARRQALKILGSGVISMPRGRGRSLLSCGGCTADPSPAGRVAAIADPARPHQIASVLPPICMSGAYIGSQSMRATFSLAPGTRCAGSAPQMLRERVVQAAGVPLWQM